MSTINLSDLKAYLANLNAPAAQQGTLTGPVAGPVSAVPTSALQQYAQQLSDSTFGAGQFPALNQVIQKESSWNPAAANPTSSASGLGQFLTSTSQQYGLGPVAANASPQDQLQAVVKYIQNRYGTPAAAAAHEAQYSWY